VLYPARTLRRISRRVSPRVSHRVSLACSLVRSRLGCRRVSRRVSRPVSPRWSLRPSRLRSRRVQPSTQPSSQTSWRPSCQPSGQSSSQPSDKARHIGHRPRITPRIPSSLLEIGVLRRAFRSARLPSGPVITAGSAITVPPPLTDRAIRRTGGRSPLSTRLTAQASQVVRSTHTHQPIEVHGLRAALRCRVIS